MLNRLESAEYPEQQENNQLTELRSNTLRLPPRINKVITLPEGQYVQLGSAGKVVLLPFMKEAEVEEIKAFDDQIFGAHQGITIAELNDINQHGAVIVVRNEKLEIVGLTQVLTYPIAAHPHLNDNEA